MPHLTSEQNIAGLHIIFTHSTAHLLTEPISVMCSWLFPAPKCYNRLTPEHIQSADTTQAAEDL